MSGTVQVAAGAPTKSVRIGPALLFGGAAILVYRTVVLLSGARSVLKRWVVALTIVEMAVDIATMLAAMRWWVTRDPHHSRPAMRFAAAATLLHAMRVSVFVLGRTGPWRDFDVRPEHRPDHDQRWTWGGVIFAGVMSALGVLGVGIIWQLRQSSLPDRGAHFAPLLHSDEHRTSGALWRAVHAAGRCKVTGAPVLRGGASSATR